MKKIYLFNMALMFAFWVNAQVLTQTIRGTIVDADSKLPIIGATVKIVGSNPVMGATTNVSGQYQIEKVPVGNITLQISYVGYEGKTIPDIEVNAGKETVLNISLQEQVVKMNEAVVSANGIDKGNARNEMNMISTRSVSLEESKRFAGSFNDPARIVSNFAGVANSANGENDIIVRGNSPKYMQWRLEGVEITNPTHFADQNGVKGGISALNTSLFAPSDFSTGAFSAEYGDVLSGVLDVKLRAGNTQKMEATLGFGILGTDLTLEGPFKKGYGGSYLINYRYSTVALISDLGLVDVPGALKFQDAAFKLVFPTKKLGVFSMFGLGGLSGFSLEDIGPDVFSTPTNKAIPGRLSEDYDKDAFLANYGLTHTINLNKKSYLSTTLAYSNNGILEDIYRTITTPVKDQQGNVYDSVGNRLLNYKNRLSRSVYRGSLTYNNKLNAKNTIQAGTKYALFVFDMNTSQLNTNNQRVLLVDRNEQIANVRNFVNWKHRFSSSITMVAGFHNMNVLYNSKSTIEPRIAVQAKINSSNSINIGYGKHSAMESVHNYFTKVTDANGNITEPNKDLDLLKADHVVLGYERRISKNMRLKAEVYYQYLYDLPVANNDTSYYATINEASDFRYVDLVNKGTGQNYGLEITLERFFADNYYFLINGSLFNSTYKSLEGVERNTMYNGNYLGNFVAGKDFVGLGKKKNQALNLNLKAFFGGGQRQILLMRDANGNLDVDPSANRFWDYKNAYRNKIDDVYEITLAINYKWNKPKATHELYINLQNITGVQARVSEYYNTKKPNGVDHVTQFGFFPNLMYRLYF